MNKELILSNLRKIVLAANEQSTYQTYLAQITIDAIEADERIQADALQGTKEAAKQRVKDGRAFMKELYNTILWLYRRLPRGYANPSHIDAVVRKLASVVGEDAEEFINERKDV